MFSKRKKQPKGPGPTELYLKGTEQPEIKKLIGLEDLSTQFREKNPYLIGYFLGKNKNDRLNMEDILQFIMETKDRNDQKQLFSLYQMSNVCLHRVFADSVDIASTALSPIGKSEPEKQYAVGVYSRIISRAIDQWPEEIWQVFWNTEGAVEKIIKNLDSSCIYQSILDCFVQKHHPHISTLLWYIFISFIPEEMALKCINEMPSFCQFIPNVEDFTDYNKHFANFHKSLTKMHKLNIVSLFIEFFKCSFDKIEEFQEQVFDYVACANENDLNEIELRKNNQGEEEVTIEIYPRLFEIAKIIGPNQKVMDKCLSILRESNDLTSLKVQYAGQYLSVCSTEMDRKTTEEVINKLLTPESKQFTMTAALKLISYVIEDSLTSNKKYWSTNKEELNSFRDGIRAKVIELWEKHSKDHLTIPNSQTPSTFMLLDSILTIARIIYNSELNEVIQEKINENKPEKTKTDNFGEEEDNDEDDEDSSLLQSMSSNSKKKPNPNDTVDADFKEIGEKWPEDIRQKIIDWSNPSFNTFNIDKKKGILNSTPEEVEKSIVIEFIDEAKAGAGSNEQAENSKGDDPKDENSEEDQNTDDQ
ncbi:hypothetical protein M9Y10_039210 [Tritrichomonas musculus]|uniref:Uncharacterized protein n=1 Tax=Tritrichomonas musculus TaxID=1915356 RepID=A0ABR2KB63_9EUKA